MKIRWFEQRESIDSAAYQEHGSRDRRKRGRKSWRWAKRMTNRMMRRAARLDPEDAPIKPLKRGFEY